MTFCQLGSAQFSLSNRACTGLLTLVGSPWATATVDSTGLPAPDDGGELDDGDGEALAAGEGEALDAGDGLADDDGDGDGESFAPIRLAPRAWVCPLDLGEALAFALPLELAEGVGAGVGVVGAVGEAGPPMVLFGAYSRTCRNRSWAVVPTRLTSSFEPLPGTDTVMMLVPCCWTVAPLKPAWLTRLSMMEMAVAMSAVVGDWPFGVSARSVTVVPLDRSRPSCTLKSCCQSPGEVRFLPTIDSSSATIRTSSVTRARPGLDLVVLGGATSSLSFGQCGQLRWLRGLVLRVPVPALAIRGLAVAVLAGPIRLGLAVRLLVGGSLLGRDVLVAAVRAVGGGVAVVRAVIGHHVHDGPPHDPDLDTGRDLQIQVLAVHRHDRAVDP